MQKPKEIDVIRRAYELWQQAGEPIGRDDEFYLAAKAELWEHLGGEDFSRDMEDCPTQTK